MTRPVFGVPMTASGIPLTPDKRIEQIEADIEKREIEIGEIEDEISSLHRDRDDLEEKVEELRAELEDLKADIPSFEDSPQSWAVFRATCTECGFDLETYGWDSLNFRAESHCFETGHEVAVLSAEKVLPFDRALETHALPLAGWPS